MVSGVISNLNRGVKKKVVGGKLGGGELRQPVAQWSACTQKSAMPGKPKRKTSGRGGGRGPSTGATGREKRPLMGGQGKDSFSGR